jgi:hypothetical protein
MSHRVSEPVASPESLKLVGGWLVSCSSMRASAPKPTNHREPREIQRGLPARRRKRSSESVPAAAPAEHQGRAAGSHEGGSRSALRRAQQARPRSPCHHAGSETGVVYMDGGREKIQRPRVRHETDGEVRLGTYEAASSSRNLFDQIVASVAEGLPVRGVELAPARRSAGVRHRECGRRRAGNGLQRSGAGH